MVSFKEELMFLSLEAQLLSPEEPRGHDGADAHAVVDEDDAEVDSLSRISLERKGDRVDEYQ